MQDSLSRTLEMSDPEFFEVVIVNYNGMATLFDTIKGLLDEGILPEQLIVSDDGSTDGSPEKAKNLWPAIRLVRQAQNCGVINRVRNAGLEMVRARYVFLTDNDIMVGRGNLERLLDVLRESPSRAIVTPRLLDYSRPADIFYDGNNLHFLGLSCESPRGRPAAELPEQPLRPTFGGGIMMIDAQLGRKIGWMDGAYLQGWGSDAEIQLRARMMGLEAVHDSRIAMLHLGKDHGKKRALGQMTNRYRLLLTYYSLPTLLFLLPSLLLFEFFLVLAAVRMGVFGQWKQAVITTLHARGELRKKRAWLQRRRQRSDTELLRGGPFELPGVVRGKFLVQGVMRIMQTALDVNWHVYRLISRLLPGQRTRPAAEHSEQNFENSCS